MAALGRVVQKLDPSISVYAAKTLKEHMGTSLFPARMAAIALGSFGVLALILAGVGIYGVMSYTISHRTGEIGIRMALGAQRRDVLAMIVSQGLILVGIGLAVGLGGALLLTRVMTTLLFDVGTTDPTTLEAMKNVIALCKGA